ncbi:MAG: hypothetical protein GF317_07855 [Candidatus Lokiarchaeota archaeon]|nr:hypothetical protein [Candidatus Lokiarchaeota archaeon]MBD3199626.1 hypothetical protein [Candidatus Lokiarchaeota archaeon]
MFIAISRKKLKTYSFTFIIVIFFSSFILGLLLFQPFQIYNDEPSDSFNQVQGNRYDTNLKVAADSEDILFQGTGSALNITDYAFLYDNNQEVSVTNQSTTNLTYYLEDINGWKADKIQNSLKSIHDTRDWVDNNSFNEVQIHREDQTYENDNHPYSNDLNNDPSIDSNIQSNITKSGALAIRVHFVNISISFKDNIFMYDENNTVCYHDDGLKNNFFSPWISGNKLKITLHSDSGGSSYGYFIDYIEFINDSSSYQINSYSWGFDSLDSMSKNVTDSGPGNISGDPSMYVGIRGDPRFSGGQYKAQYYVGDYSELYQDLTIPRGELIDANLEFDYYIQFAYLTTGIEMYCDINGETIYSENLENLIALGRKQWHSTGLISLSQWSNTSNVFVGDLNSNNINISLGIRIKSDNTLNGFDQGQQIIWFDDIFLTLTTKANATQPGINLSINSQSINDGSSWGEGDQTLNGLWEKNPITLTITTDSPDLEFQFDTNISLFRQVVSDQNEDGIDGTEYEILKNGSVYWGFKYNHYKPVQYTDFEFKIFKPTTWKIKSVLDPTDNSEPFDGGDYGDSFLFVNRTFATFPGWWSIEAISNNYINKTNTKLAKNNTWGYYTFFTDDTLTIGTQINYSNNIPPTLDSTEAELSLYFPNASLWYSESQFVSLDGTVNFSDVDLTSDLLGGIYSFEISWTNGTEVGGINSTFIIKHQVSMILTRPEDAFEDFRTDAFVGDIIPLRVFLKDIENNRSISGAHVSYNYTSGDIQLEDAGTGIYEEIIDTELLSTGGLYNIVISSSLVGFFDVNITLEINLGEISIITRLASQYFIELHANGTVQYNFTKFNGDPIDNATISVNIDLNLYFVNNTDPGIYLIEFSTSNIDDLGIYQIIITFEAPGIEKQIQNFQFEIIEQSVNLNVYIDQTKLTENSIINKRFNEELNISVSIYAVLDDFYLSNTSIEFLSGGDQIVLNHSNDRWFNTSLFISNSFFVSGINYVQINFQAKNYKSDTFNFQVIVGKIDYNIKLMNFGDTINIKVGESPIIKINLTEKETNNYIENATIFLNWAYGIKKLSETAPGIYEMTLNVPADLRGTYEISLSISKNSLYELKEISYFLVITEEIIPNNLLWIGLITLLGIVGILSIVFVRSYLYLPRKREKERKLLEKVQPFKDIRNIVGVNIIHRNVGVTLYSKKYSFLKEQDESLFGGFIQAIMIFGEQVGFQRKSKKSDGNKYGNEIEIIDLDFKYFHLLLSDYKELRILLILKESPSNILKDNLSILSKKMYFEISEELINFQGVVIKFKKLIPPILYKYLRLHFKEPFTINDDPSYFLKTKNEQELTSMEIRIINVVESYLKNKDSFDLANVFNLTSETDENKIIMALEGLIERRLFIPYKGEDK